MRREERGERRLRETMCVHISSPRMQTPIRDPPPLYEMIKFVAELTKFVPATGKLELFSYLGDLYPDWSRRDGMLGDDI
jgi:hypothetical protein